MAFANSRHYALRYAKMNKESNLATFKQKRIGKIIRFIEYLVFHWTVNAGRNITLKYLILMMKWNSSLGRISSCHVFITIIKFK